MAHQVGVLNKMYN